MKRLLVNADDLGRTFGINLEGLKRRGFSEDAQKHIKAAYKIIFQSKLKFLHLALGTLASPKFSPSTKEIS